MRQKTEPWGMFALSFVCHLAILSLVLWSHSPPASNVSEGLVTYVDTVTISSGSSEEGPPSPTEEQAAGIPTTQTRGSSPESGSAYAGYIQSRIQEVLKKEVVSQGRPLEVLVSITIGPSGRITDYRLDRSSGDPKFDDAVSKTVIIAGWTFRPPPDGLSFTHRFLLKPEGVALP
jgi:TonB family protein